jgi:hypothetical protein
MIGFTSMIVTFAILESQLEIMRMQTIQMDEIRRLSERIENNNKRKICLCEM